MTYTPREKRLSEAAVEHDSHSLSLQQFAKYCLSHSVIMADESVLRAAITILAYKALGDKPVNLERKFNNA